MRIFLLLLMIIFVSSAQCALDDDTVVKLYADLGIEYKPDKKTDAEYDAELKKLQYEAKKGSAEALYKIGRMFEAGQGSLKADMKKALTCYEKAAAKNNAAAMNHLAGMYMTGQGVEADIDKALELYKKSAELGNSDAMCNMGMLEEKGLINGANLAKAEDWYHRAAEAGNTVGMYRTGKKYTDVYDRDYKKALKWLEKAAAGGNSSAMILLGHLYASYSSYISRDMKKASSYYFAAAAKGNNEALRTIIETGKGNNCDDPEIKKFAEMFNEKEKDYHQNVSKKGLAPNCVHLVWNQREYDEEKSDMPLLREGVYRDLEFMCILSEDGETEFVKERAVPHAPLFKWAEKKSLEGSAPAMCFLGTLYRKGNVPGDEWLDGKKRMEKCFELLEKSAQLGYAGAMFEMGEIYRGRASYMRTTINGKPMLEGNYDETIEKAAEWYRKAVVKGHKEAKKALDNIKK